MEKLNLRIWTPVTMGDRYLFITLLPHLRPKYVHNNTLLLKPNVQSCNTAQRQCQCINCMTSHTCKYSVFLLALKNRNKDTSLSIFFFCKIIFPAYLVTSPCLGHSPLRLPFISLLSFFVSVVELDNPLCASGTETCF